MNLYNIRQDSSTGYYQVVELTKEWPNHLEPAWPIPITWGGEWSWDIISAVYRVQIGENGGVDHVH